MLKEKWVKWQPVENLSENYIFHSYIFGEDGLEIIFYNDHELSKKMVVFFESSFGAGRIADLSLNKKILNSLKEEFLEENIQNKWYFFKIINSNYAQWLTKESYNTSNACRDIHFVFINKHLFIDVIAIKDPTISVSIEN